MDNIIISSEGIKFRSIFNELSTFHVCQAGLPPCLAHDLFECVIAYHVPLLLKCFIEAKFLTVDTLNHKIRTFQLQHSDGNVRPAALSVQMKRLSGSASQNWCFLRILPLLIAEFIEEKNSDLYQLLLLLHQIVEFIVAPSISISQIAYMKILIEDYLDKRQKLFPHKPLRPKHHYLTHYAIQMLQLGPLCQF